jgi:hypothetical protein
MARAARGHRPGLGRPAIETIVEQGEGARGDWIKSHFGTFAGILEDLLAEQAADPAFNPARPVEPAFVRLPPDVEAGTLIEDLTTAQVADLALQLLVGTLLSAFGTFWAVEGLGIAWPGADLAIIALAAWYVLAAAAHISGLRRQARHARQLAHTSAR